jgi:hypothetical protein
VSTFSPWAFFIGNAWVASIKVKMFLKTAAARPSQWLVVHANNDMPVMQVLQDCFDHIERKVIRQLKHSANAPSRSPFTDLQPRG